MALAGGLMPVNYHEGRQLGVAEVQAKKTGRHTGPGTFTPLARLDQRMVRQVANGRPSAPRPGGAGRRCGGRLGRLALFHSPRGEKIRNVVLISIDTCRADHLGCYGYSAGTTPNIDALGHGGLRFTSVITPYPMTLPAHCSMLTGTYPKTHGVRWNADTLGEANPTLARVLRGAGYQTAGFVGGLPLSARFGLGQGFETYDDKFPRTGPGIEPERKAEEVSRRGMAWLEKHDGQPFFLFLHYYDPHFPYDPPPPFPQTYDGELAYVNHWIGKVMEKLHALGRDDDTLVAVTGDHGEGLGEHGEKEHGFLVYQNTLEVPLIVRYPGCPQGRQIDAKASLIDLVPTLLGLLRVDVPRQVQGQDLSGLCRAGRGAGRAGRAGRGRCTARRCGPSRTIATRSIR